MAKQVLILHGWRNRRWEGHWQRLAAAELRARGHQVFYPQLPSTDEPRFQDWAEVAATELQLIREANRGEEIVVIGHSLGSITWLKLVEHELTGGPIGRALLVAPADPELLTDIADFIVDVPAIRSLVEASANSTTLVGSDDDQWIPRGIQKTFGEPLGLNAVVIEGAKHLSLADGWGDWQGVINWVEDPASDLTVR